MQKLDMAMYAATQDNPGGPVYMMIEDNTPQIAPYADDAGKVTRGGAVGYLIAYALIFGVVAYFMLGS